MTTRLAQWALFAGFVPLASAATIAPPEVPSAIRVPSDQAIVLKAHATGSQIYVCATDAGGKPQWTLKGPDARLHDQKGRVVGHHFAGPAWKHNDGSEVTAKSTAHVNSPDPSSIPWLLLTATGHTGAGVLANVSSIQRIHTKGGNPPAVAQCTTAKQGTETRTAYSADYYFYASSR